MGIFHIKTTKQYATHTQWMRAGLHGTAGDPASGAAAGNVAKTWPPRPRAARKYAAYAAMLIA
jgi:hypothetical protein